MYTRPIHNCTDEIQSWKNHGIRNLTITFSGPRKDLKDLQFVWKVKKSKLSDWDEKLGSEVFFCVRFASRIEC